MTKESSVANAQSSRQTMVVIWAAMLISHIVFAVVAWFAAIPVPEAPPQTVLYVLTAVGLSVPLGAPVLSALLLNTARAQGPLTLPKLLPAFVVELALREAGAVMAFLIMVMFGEPLYWAVVAGVAFASTVVSFPSQGWINNKLGQHQRRGPLGDG